MARCHPARLHCLIPGASPPTGPVAGPEEARSDIDAHPDLSAGRPPTALQPASPGPAGGQRPGQPARPRRPARGARRGPRPDGRGSEVIGDILLASITDLRTARRDAADLGGSTWPLPGGRRVGAPASPPCSPGDARHGGRRRVRSGTTGCSRHHQVGPEALDQVALLARGLVPRQRATSPTARSRSPVRSPLIRRLKDPDVDRALSFFATVAKAVGQELAAPPTPHR